jgi:hypothetical protein
MNKILEIKFGSHLYGTNTENSDLDFKGIYLPTAKEIVLGTYKKTIATCRPKATCERNTKDDIDVEVFSLDRYLDLLMQGQTVALDMIFAPMEESYYRTYDGKVPGLTIWRTIKDNKDKLLTRNVNAFVGYAKQQCAKYGIKGSRMDALKRTAALLEDFTAPRATLNDYRPYLETLVEQSRDIISLEKLPLIEIVMLKGPKGELDAPHLKVNGRSIPFHATVKYAKDIVGKMLDSYGARAEKAHIAGGKDWKAISHCLRVNGEALELLNTGHITFPRPDRDLLLKVKLGQLPYDEVAEMIEQGLADLYIAHEKSTLRDEPDREWADNFVYEVYSKIVRETQ